MRLKVTWNSDTSVQLNIEADANELDKYKRVVLEKLAPSVKVAGFRTGHTPANVVEKNVDPNVLQTEFLDEAMTQLYTAAAKSEKLKPVAPPKVTVKKFVPFTQLEFELEVPVVGDIKLPDYKKIKVPKPEVKVTAADVNDVIKNLLARSTERKEVERAAKNGDEVVIDFAGSDKTGAAISGASGQDYPLTLGSNSFIPGFEPELIGLKAGVDKTFSVTFPKDYHAPHLQNQKVTFKVTVKKVNEMVEPNADDKFASTVGPFKTIDELKADIKRQLTTEKQSEAKQAHADAIVKAVSDKTKVAIPDSLIDEQIDRMEQDEKQNLMYRGQTWEEHLKAEGITAEKHREEKRPAAIERVKAGLVLSEIAAREKLVITPEELDAKMDELKRQYPDPKMLAELEKTENRREIASRMLSEKAVNVLTGERNV